MLIKKALFILGFIGILIPSPGAAEEPLQLPPEIRIHLLPDMKIYSGELNYLPIYLCQDEAVAREILNAWWEYGELTRDLLKYFATKSKGEKIPEMADCLRYDGFAVPIRNLGNWPNLPDSTEFSQRFISVTLIEVELFVLFDDELSSTKFYGFLEDNAVASR